MHKISYWLVIRKNRCQRDSITCVYIPSYHALTYPHCILNLYRMHSPLSGKTPLIDKQFLDLNSPNKNLLGKTIYF